MKGGIFMLKKDVLISVYELNPDTGLYVAAVAAKRADGKVEISFYMGESRISSQFLYGIYEDLEFSQCSLDLFLAEWFKERSYSMYHDYYAMIDEQ